MAPSPLPPRTTRRDTLTLMAAGVAVPTVSEPRRRPVGDLVPSGGTWDIAAVPPPPELENATVYGKGGQPWPTAERNGFPFHEFDGRGGDLLIEAPASGTVFNASLRIRNCRRVVMRGVHLQINDPRFTLPRYNAEATRDLANKYEHSFTDFETIPETGRSTRARHGPRQGQRANAECRNWTTPNYSEVRHIREVMQYSPYVVFYDDFTGSLDDYAGLNVFELAFNDAARAFYIEGCHFDIVEGFWAHQDLMLLFTDPDARAPGTGTQSAIGDGFTVDVVNTRMGVIGVGGPDDFDVHWNGGRSPELRVIRSRHCDVVQLMGLGPNWSTLDWAMWRFGVWNSDLFGQLQILFLPWNQGGKYNFATKNAGYHHLHGDNGGSHIWLADWGHESVPILDFHNVWMRRGPGGGEDSRNLCYAGHTSLAPNHPLAGPRDYTVWDGEGDRTIRLRDTEDPEVPEFAPASAVGLNYRSPWAG